ncbi:hypothetical protein P9A14_18670 [Gordonia hongkongensis]|uniref:PE-PGRS family protein n=1 Tax=Gordonia hongkongensis TaxID=1701090 RepID=A0AAX3T5P2_9ACTN|nr:MULTISPECIES: hypothetical protein [Gordonia]MCX2754756.1 hypothetical protein [Gordonia sp. 4N]MDT0220073.1 hypothetical protein [Gordonia sp. AC31]WFP24136.1 hypothetical protein P9A14_18670 [Gordonia hongkongensis]SCC58615.1 hypothetical protein GA0061091_1322 [Gordonia sp. v-85]
MTRLGRSGIQRSEKVARRENRKQRRQHRAIAGAAALATVAAIGAGQVAEPTVAEAAVIPPAIGELDDWLNGFNSGNPLGSLISEIGNGALADIAEQWRIQSCLSGGVRDGADCSQSSTELGGIGLAVVLPDRIEVVPVAIYDPVKQVFDTVSGSVLGDILRFLGIDLPPTMTDGPATEGSATVAGNGFQFALAYRGGDATATSYLPLSIATAGASDGRTARSFALIGMAHAWNTGPLDVTVLGETITTIPGVQGVGCYGGLTGAYADGVGACANVLGTFDFRWQQPNGELQFALTDPTALIADPGGVLGGLGADVLEGLLAGALSGSGIDFDGDWMSLSKDFARLSIGGDYDLFSGNFLRLTSDYGFTAPITVDWLGSTVTFRPLVEVNGELRPNRLGMPVIEFGQLDTGELVPVIRIPSYEFPFGLPATDPIDTGASNTVARTSMSVVDTSADSAATDDETDEADSYVGKHRSAENSYVGKHRAPATSEEGGVGNSDAGDSDAPEPGGSDSDTSDPDTSDSDGAGSDAADSDAADSDTSDSDGNDSGSDSDSSADSDSGSDSEDAAA